MKEIAAAIEDDGRDARRLRPAPRAACRRPAAASLFGAGLEAAAQRLLDARRRGQRTPRRVVDHLGIDVLRRAEHGQPRPLACDVARKARAHPLPATIEELNRVCSLIAAPYFFLPSLRRIVSVIVLDALALVGLGPAERADHGGDLADALPVGAGDRDRGRLLAGDLDVGRDRELDVVAVAELQVQSLPWTAAR